ncbi:MAG: tetratricopeptide repeat protein [Pseudomonadota bacterium]
MNSVAAWLAGVACALLLAAAPARAAVLDEIELLRVRDDAVVRIKFSLRVQYLRHTLIGNDAANVFVQFGGPPTDTTTDEQLRIPETQAFPGVTVIYPLQLANPPFRIVVRFSRPTKFTVRAAGPNAIDLVVPGAGPQVTAARARFVPVPGADAQRYAIRLQTFADRAMEGQRPVPAEFQDYTVFTSQSRIDSRTRYELLLGYFASADDAERARRRLASRFPEATIVDLQQRREEVLTAAAAAPTAPVPAAPAAPAPLPVPAAPPAVAAAPPPAAADVEAQAAQLLQKARAALDGNNAEAAIETLNQLLTLPPNRSTEPAQELIGVARERNGEIAKARSEYALYLKLFPQGAGAERVRQRLAKLEAAPVAERPAARERPALKSLTGTFSQYYFGGKTRIDNVFNTPTTADRSTFTATDQSLLVSSIDLNGRYRGADAEQRVVFRDSYNLSFLQERGSFNRLNAAYYDYRGLTNAFSARLGRQTGLSGGLPGRFDGGIVGYGFTPSVRLNAVGGAPVEFTNIDSKRRFVGANLDMSGVLERWYGNVFGIRQTVDGILDREAVGAEVRYLDPQTTMYAVVDYDTSFKALNAASLQGSWTSVGRTSINLLWDRRRAPTLATLNAVFGQPTTSIRDLLVTLSEDEIRQLAKTITAVATQGLVGVTTPLSQHWQVGADVRLVKVGALPQVVVNGVTMPAQPATGNVISYSLQSIGSNLYSSRDSSVFTVMLVNGPTYDSWLLTYNNVTGLFERWSFEPSLRYYQQRDTTDVKLARVSPSLRLSWRPTQASVLELDYLLERTRTTAPTTSDTTTRHFLSIGYRLDL